MFDRVIVLDWSANSVPKRGKDSIWLAHFDSDTPDGRAVNVATRHEALDQLEVLMCGQRTLLAVDFSLGYPRGTAVALGLTGLPWEAMWALLDSTIVDEVDNANNRFDVAAELNRRVTDIDGPFWGRPHTQTFDGLTTKKVSCDPLPEWRYVEEFLRARRLRPFSSWQLLGAGAVGSQSLLGIASMARLRRRLVDVHHLHVDVWPFTTGLTEPQIRHHGSVIAEIWPSMVPVVDNGLVHDEAQVLTLGSHVRRADQNAELMQWFAPEAAGTRRQAIIEEEGWVLGAGTGLVPQ